MMRVLLLSGMLLLAGATGASAASPGEETEHVVAAGETLNGIANRAGVARDRIIEANALEPPYLIRIGQTLKIPRESRPARRTIAARSPSDNAPDTHLVEAGETLGGIAHREGVPRVLIAEANGLVPPYTIRTGQKLLIPRTRRHTVKAGDTGFSIAYDYAVPWNDIATANGLDPEAPIREGKELLIPTVIEARDPAPVAAAPTPQIQASRFAWPAEGPIRRGYRSRAQGNYHDGLDIEAPKGSAVRAADAGTVIFAGREKTQFGNLVVIDHGDGWHTAYGSLGRVTVKEGHRVAKGERVGLVGDTSVTKRTELHFELRRNGQPVDPASELPENK